MSGLRAQQQALDITGHNIANASTEGYHRQEAVMVSGNPLSGAFISSAAGSPQLGTGVLVQSVRRMQSDYVENQVRMANQWLGMWDYKNESLKQVETVLGEPGDGGISSFLDKFWNGWSDLTTSQSLTSRTAVVEAGNALSNQVRAFYGNIRELQSRADEDIADNAAQINRLASDIASFNEQIWRSEGGGYQPNDLIDRRDILLDQLSQIARIQVSGGGGSEMRVSIYGKTLIQGDQTTEIETSVGAGGWTQLTWGDDHSKVEITGGQLAGQIELRDKTLEDYISSLNSVVRTLVDRVNAIHSTGLTETGQPAGNFFVAGSDASNLAVQATPADVAVADPTPAPDRKTPQQQIADLKAEVQPNGETIGDAYSGLVASIGADAREANARASMYGDSLQQLKMQRESISGVSLDEEMLNMVKYQQAYNAAARVMSVMNDLIDTVINRTGVG
jgi:flagellar hook-associated protein 1 FlgK